MTSIASSFRAKWGAVMRAADASAGYDDCSQGALVGPLLCFDLNRRDVLSKGEMGCGSQGREGEVN